MKPFILIVEDDVAYGSMLQKWFVRNSFQATHCSSVAGAQSELKKQTFQLVLTDLRLPDGDGISLLHWMREQNISTPILVMTSYGEISSAVSAIKLGAEDFLEKPVNPSVLYEKVQQILSGNTLASKKKQEKKASGGAIVGKSPAFVAMQKMALKVASTKMTVLILGESGTGKEYTARMIHENSSRKDQPFITVDCGSLSRELAPSELFGHLKGSFTSAVSNKTGVFEQASGGTVFLDEVGNLSYDVQVQLLRALQERKVRPVGAVNDVQVDVRIIAATNENLEQAIAQGRFREDLYYRLNEISVMVPPLRERKEDIALFAGEFLRQANDELERDVKGFSAEAVQLLEQQSWSGNLRELRNTVRRIVLFAEGEYITADDLPFSTQQPSLAPDADFEDDSERDQIVSMLKKARGNKTLAAQLLQIDRKTLYNKMHLYGIKL